MEAQIHSLFEEIDADHSGYLDRNELRRVFSKIGVAETEE
jgi:Ca2+-binding EF-hand superfamily protein